MLKSQVLVLHSPGPLLLHVFLSCIYQHSLSKTKTIMAQKSTSPSRN